MSVFLSNDDEPHTPMPPAIISGGVLVWLTVAMLAIGMVGLFLCWVIPAEQLVQQNLMEGLKK